jgi:hypothetical protein
MAAMAGETAVGAIIVNIETDNIDGISILEYFSSRIIFYTFPKLNGG